MWFDTFADWAATSTDADPMGYAFFPKSFFLKKDLPKKKKDLDALAGCAHTRTHMPSTHTHAHSPQHSHPRSHPRSQPRSSDRFVGQVSKVNADAKSVVVTFHDGCLEYPVEQTFKGKKAQIYMKNLGVYFITAHDEKIGDCIAMKVPLVAATATAPPSPPSMPPSFPPSPAIEQASAPPAPLASLLASNHASLHAPLHAPLPALACAG